LDENHFFTTEITIKHGQHVGRWLAQALAAESTVSPDGVH
jgi:hypothetical protein